MILLVILDDFILDDLRFETLNQAEELGILYSSLYTERYTFVCGWPLSDFMSRPQKKSIEKIREKLKIVLTKIFPTQFSL